MAGRSRVRGETTNSSSLGEDQQTVNRLLHPGFYGRRYSPYPATATSHNISGEGPGDVTSLFQSISASITDIQSQLTAIREKNEERDESLKNLEKDIEELKSASKRDAEPPKQKRSRKSPRGLSACVRRIHTSLNDDDRYDGTTGVKSEHNKAVTNKLVEHVLGSGAYSDRQEVEYAAKKHHEYLVRQTEELEDTKLHRLKRSRMLQRRLRLFERRSSKARGKEIAVMQQLSEKVMTDEETDSEDSNSFIRRSLPWRSEKLNQLFKALDERQNTSVKKNRKTGPPSDRVCPSGLPSWSLCVSTALNSSSSSPSVSHTSMPSLQVASPAPSSTSVDQGTPLSQAVTAPLVSTPGILANTPPTSTEMPFYVEQFPAAYNSSGHAFCNTPVSRRIARPRFQTFHSSTSFRSGEESASEEEADDELSDWIHAVTAVRL